MTPHSSREKRKAIWHHTLHPSVRKHSEANAFPRWFGQYLHPTTATLSLPRKDHTEEILTEDHPCTSYKKGEDSGDTIFEQHWKSRHNRKHRYVCATPGPGPARASRHADSLWVAIWHMVTRLEYWNVSWWVAQAFTWGSVAWCLNGFFALMPLIYPSTFANSLKSTGWSAFIGATIFEAGSVLGLWEAWNRDDRTSFGWNISHTFHELENELEEVASRAVDKVRPSLAAVGSHISYLSHVSTLSEKIKPGKPWSTDFKGTDDINHGVSPQHSNESSSKKALQDPEKGLEDSTATSPQGPPEISYKRWIWFSTDTKYFREAGFLAAFFQMMGATIFWISGFTAIPHIQKAIQERTGVYDGVYWVPQVVGGMGFVISSTFIMLETQTKWYKPKPLDIGWHVGLWNFIGGLGFTACGALGFGAASNSGVEFQSVICTFWGSWAFLIGSVAQWYESVNCV